MLPKDRPVLILMDEIISYVSTYRKKGFGDRLYNFLDCLAETARGEKNVAVVVSIPASELEYTADDIADETRFKKMLDRLGKAIMMSADTEMAEIIRRRLFDWHGATEDVKRTATAYAEWAVEHAQELTGIDADTARSFPGCLPVPPVGAVGVRAEVAKPASVPADARRAALAGPLGRATTRRSTARRLASPSSPLASHRCKTRLSGRRCSSNSAATGWKSR